MKPRGLGSQRAPFRGLFFAYLITVHVNHVTFQGLTRDLSAWVDNTEQ